MEFAMTLRETEKLRRFLLYLLYMKVLKLRALASVQRILIYFKFLFYFFLDARSLSLPAFFSRFMKPTNN